MLWAPFILAFLFLVCIALAIAESGGFRGKAEAKGLQLLLDNLSPQQRKQYDHFGYFDVLGSHTGKPYRIRHGASRNVTDLQHGDLGTGRCFLPEGDLVIGDCMLAQKIALENCEEEVLRAAVRF